MITEINFTLVGDGPADKSLMPILNWMIKRLGFSGAIDGSCVDFRLFRSRGTGNRLADRVLYSLEFFPCNLLFIHRDAKGRGREERLAEIAEAVQIANGIVQQIPRVCVIPVRMTEAWLLFNEDAIRYAAGNLSGRIPLPLPALNTLEQLPDPKSVLHQLITLASGLSPHRRQAFSAFRFQHRITEYVEDFTQLEALASFRALEDDLAQALADLTIMTGCYFLSQ